MNDLKVGARGCPLPIYILEAGVVCGGIVDDLRIDAGGCYHRSEYSAPGWSCAAPHLLLPMRAVIAREPGRRAGAGSAVGVAVVVAGVGAAVAVAVAAAAITVVAAVAVAEVVDKSRERQCRYEGVSSSRASHVQSRTDKPALIGGLPASSATRPPDQLGWEPSSGDVSTLFS